MKTVTLEVAQNMLKDNKIDSALFEQGYTILMPKKRAKNWLKALRSGEYIQAEGILHDPIVGGFCCLGVEQYCNNDGFVENSFEEYGDAYGDWNNFPSLSYLREAGMLYVNANNKRTENPYINSVDEYVSELNDNISRVIKKVNQHKAVTTDVHVNDFAKMADYLDKAMLVY